MAGIVFWFDIRAIPMLLHPSRVWFDQDVEE